MDGLLKGSDESLQKTFELEEKVNDAEVEVDALCNKFIVLRAPAAYDLRFVLCTLRMIRDIERIGDEAEKMARMAKFFHDDVHTIAPKPNLSLMVNDVVQMLEHIIDYSTTHGDRMERNVLGHLSSKTISHNIYTKSYSTKIYDYIGDYDKHTHIYDDPEKKQAHPIYSASKDLLGKRPGEHVSKTFLQPDTSNTDGKDTSITNRTNDYVYDGFLSEAWLPDRTSQVGMLLNGLTVEMKVHGNTFTNAGDMVRISVPYQGVRDGNNPSETDKFISGRFLVKTINHVFTVATFTHEMDLTCVKDSINYELDFIENGTPDGDQQPRHREVYEDFYL